VGQPMRLRKCTGTSAGATPMWLTPICPNTSIQFHTASFSNRWLAGSWTGTCCDQAVGEGAGRETGRGGNRAQEWRQEQHARHAAGRRREPVAGQYLHEPVPETLAADRTRRGVPCTRRRVCRRLRHSQPRSCSRGAAWTKAVMTKLGLTLNEAKTSVRNARQECFDFLGYAFGPHHDERGGER